MEAEMEAVAHAALANQAASTTPLSITLPALAPGEFHGGIHFDESGTPTHWVICRLPKEPSRLDWTTAMAQHGDAMPTRREALLLDANARQHIPAGLYWTGEQHAGYDDFAWCQIFGNGHQVNVPKSGQFRVVLGQGLELLAAGDRRAIRLRPDLRRRDHGLAPGFFSSSDFCTLAESSLTPKMN